MANSIPLIDVRNLKKHFPVQGELLRRSAKHWIRAVDGVSFALYPSETFSLVGESGCGKTTTAKMVLRLETPTAGSILFEGNDIERLRPEELKLYRSSVQAVFQDPWSSLDPRMRAGAIIAEPLVVNHKPPRKVIEERIADLLRQVGLHPQHAYLYPHQFSGGQRQRVAIARALSINPRLIVLDEPVSALDVSIRAQILNLLKDLQDRLGFSYLIIAHNLATVRYMSHRVAVMYFGKIVETAPTQRLFSRPLHPYTRALISAALDSRPDNEQEKIVLPGEVPSPMNPPPGCAFHPRCSSASPRCSETTPVLKELESGHWVACGLAGMPAVATTRSYSAEELQ
jgi:oligopeptide/dipeptide ABC transporter ATP-binding protein